MRYNLDHYLFVSLLVWYTEYAEPTAVFDPAALDAAYAAGLAPAAPTYRDTTTATTTTTTAAATQSPGGGGGGGGGVAATRSEHAKRRRGGRRHENA